jgi:hypothetical protein
MDWLGSMCERACCEMGICVGIEIDRVGDTTPEHVLDNGKNEMC